ncbi:MAG: glutamine--fructose-6-phosphate transaminase (isomerizing) [Bacteroidales bacterium]|nr:glutamine--fructose-6-phosphate transaminase (isomerizing) [Bacteroidales bacterium]MBP5240544.1 glutamine--fructose-6-phosphate transaminase (isomerizing) [Bacteroidales bacterium]
MCGIVGYLGSREAYPILIKGLHRLEYRGYDSAGIALINKELDLSVYKTKGKVEDLENYVADKDVSGTIGIAHTRWATHGEPNSQNAHPHYSQSGRLALIHNGIIENYKVLKEELISKGYTFSSDTDTEVLIQLIEYMQMSHNTSIYEAVQLALKNVIGAYAIAIIDKTNPNQLIAARKGSPLIIGVGDKEFLIGSDATPIVEYTNKVIYLEEEEIAVMKRNGEISITNLSNVPQTPIIKTLELNLSQLEKANFPHFMLKEIFEQPEALRTSMLGRLNMESKTVRLSGIIDHRDKFLKAKRIIICACGTSWHAGLIGKYIIEELTRIPVEVEYSSEFRYRNPVITKEDIVIAISQSGETADTLAAIKLAKDNGAFVYGICNVVGSSIARASDTGSYLHVGPEIGVASTKAFTAQVTTLTLIAMNIAEEKKTISKERIAELVEELQQIPEKINQTLQMNMRIKLYAQIFTYARNFIYLGRGFNYPVALEGALKLKEISYIHAEGYPAAEMKHGPIALIDEEMPVVVIAPKRGMYEKVLSNIQEVKARKGKIISIVTKGDTAVKELSDFCLEIPDTEECFVPILSVVPLQLLSYHIAIAKGRNVDQPRNLAKSVTVE